MTDTTDPMADLERRLKPYRDQFSSFRELPADGLPRAEVTSMVQRLASAEERAWREGYASGAVYNGDPEHVAFLSSIYTAQSQRNPLHPDLWPSATEFEAEIVAMTASMLGGGHAPPGTPVVGTVSSGGTESILLAMKAYRDFAREHRGIAEPEIVAPAPPGSGGVIFTPWLYGERTPVEDRFVRGGFHNLSLAVSREDLVRAVFEGVAFNTRWLLQAVERFTRRRLEPIRFIGGGARSDVWCQIFADVLGRTIEQVADPVHAGTRGTGLLAAVALGELTFDQVPDRVRVTASYQPDPAPMKLYDDLFREFVGLYRRNRKAYARLNRERAT